MTLGPLHITFVHSSDRLLSDGQVFGLHFPPVWAFTLAAHCAEIPGIEFHLVDDRVQPLRDAVESAIFLYSGMNQDCQAILANRAALAERFPRAIHCLGGPITWSFQQAGKLAQLSPFDHIFIGDGENALPAFLQSRRAGETQEKILTAKTRFELTESRPMHRGLIEKTRGRYYGAVIEVSRGCPFLCEFCDIRVMPDNNRSHVKPAAAIIEEIDHLSGLGLSQIILACDNFIGNSKWADELCDAIIAWKARTGRAPGFYTWLSIDLARHPGLMRKLKLAGIEMLFIGVESFHKNSLLETSKIQNTTLDIVEEIRHIQSHGLIVVAGLIFGFDTDPRDIVNITLNGIRSAGLISGDPSLLTALPGTPLYFRMSLSKRLREGKVGLGGMKYQTNIKYLKPVDAIVNDFTRFVARFNTGEFQYARLASFYSCLPASLPAMPARKKQGFGHLFSALKIVLRRGPTAYLLAKRIVMLLASFDRFYFILQAARLTRAQSKQGASRWFYFKFWLVNWSNSVLKYSRLSARDFDIGAVDEGFSLSSLVPPEYEQTIFEPIPGHKAKMQRKNTADQLRRLIAEQAAP